MRKNFVVAGQIYICAPFVASDDSGFECAEILVNIFGNVVIASGELAVKTSSHALFNAEVTNATDALTAAPRSVRLTAAKNDC